MKKIGMLFICIFLLVTKNSFALPIHYSGEIFDNSPVFGSTIDGNDYWHFEANAGDAVTITMNRVANIGDNYGTLDPFITFYQGYGDWDNLSYLTHNDDGGSDTPEGPWGNALISNFTLPSDSIYTVWARGVWPNHGPYYLEVTGISQDNNPVPEPSAFLLFFTGAVGIYSLISYRRKQSDKNTIKYLK